MQQQTVVEWREWVGVAVEGWLPAIQFRATTYDVRSDPLFHFFEGRNKR